MKRENSIDEAKRKAALQAVKHVKNNFVVGLGSGTTAAYAIKEIGKKIKREKICVLAIPTSYQAFNLAIEQGIPLTTLEEYPTLDLTIDGADQIDNELNMIKGMGGALSREKIVASASKELIIIADKTKKVEFLGENNHPIPIEVLTFAVPTVTSRIREIKGKPILRESNKKVGPVITDNGNVIIDASFGLVHEPSKLECNLKRIPGVVETGLFIEMADLVYLGEQSIRKKSKRKQESS